MFNEYRLGPYGGLLTCFTLGITTFAMAFGFVVPRSEYYGLPTFMLGCALSVSGTFLANSYNIAIGVKLFIGFLCPSIGLTLVSE